VLCKFYLSLGFERRRRDDAEPGSRAPLASGDA